MARGKKRDKKKKEVPSMASLSLGETQPSTSQQQQQEQPQSDDECSGLTGGGRKKKKKTHKEKAESMEETQSPASDSKEYKQQVEAEKLQEVASTSKDTDRQKRKESKDDEDDGYVGLGLEYEKKTRRKKKKSDHSASDKSVKQSVPGPQSVPAPQGLPAPLPTTPTEPVQSASSSSAWGSRHKPTFMAVTSPTTPQVREETPSIPPAFGMEPQPGGSGIQSAGRGRGRGYAGLGSGGPRGDSVRSSALAPMCLFKIPDKILGRSVPCRQMRVQANYLEMTIQAIQIHRYDVIFKPEKPKKFTPMAYAMVVKKYFGRIPLAFDQWKNVYAMTALPGVPGNDRLKCEVVINDDNEKPLEFEVSFKFTGIVDLNTILTHMKNGGTSMNPPNEAIQAVDVILHQGKLESYIKAGQQFFKRPARPIDLGDGIEMWGGLLQSAIFTSRPFVNVDVVHKGFPRCQLLIDAYSRDFGLDTSRTIAEQRGRSVNAFLQYLKGLKVTAYVGGDIQKGMKREFICNELVEPPRRMFFTMNEGTPQETRSSVMDYFEKEKKCRIRYPNLNCVWVGRRDKRIYYPLEFLQVSYGQDCHKQLNDMQKSTLVRDSATPPHDRRQKIEEVIANMNYSKSELFKKFGLEIANQFVSVDAKVLQPPKIELGGGTTVEPSRGAWQTRRLLKAQALDSWGLISVETNPKTNFDSIVNMIMGVGNDMGMQVKNPKFVSFGVKINELMRTLQMAKDKGLTFLFGIISEREKDYYHMIKRMAEREVGILTQCIREFTASRQMNEQVVRNIMLKVNSKLMGINHALDSRSIPMCLQQGKVMIVGADVTHPSPDQRSVPSIAAITASIDPKFIIYNLTLSVQAPKKEMIVDFEDMMVEHLNEFEKQQRELPSKIFVFRDGVSEGQFAQVMNNELQAVHNAYKRKTGHGSTRRAEVLFLLVQKRHHTRLFLGTSKSNVEPGTVVDTHIVHPKELDFYLVSQQAIKGTVRPTRYHVVCNDSQISQDEVEQLTFYLCHLYARCSRSVAYPTPTYYAHLACLRARSLTFGDKFYIPDLEKSPQRLRVLERILEMSKMFYV